MCWNEVSTIMEQLVVSMADINMAFVHDDNGMHFQMVSMDFVGCHVTKMLAPTITAIGCASRRKPEKNLDICSCSIVW